MSKKKSFIDSVRVKTPCSEAWAEMRGNDKVRFCSHCSKHVNNFSQMTRKEAMRLVRASDGDICVRYVPDPRTRKPLFAEELLQITRRTPRLAAGVMSASLGLSTLAYAQGGPGRVDAPQAHRTADKVDETQPAKTDRPVGRVTGIILDPMGAVIAGATVRFVSVNEKDTAAQTTTNDDGRFAFENIADGDYSLEFTASGFKVLRMNGVRVLDGKEAHTTGTMEVAAATVTVGIVSFSEEVELKGELAVAVSDDDIDEVRALIARGADVNAREDDKTTPLFIAVENGNLEIAEMLLNFGAKVNARNKEKQTPIMGLDDDATPELLELLIKHGAKLDLVDKQGNTVLILAAGEVEPAVLRALIDARADVNSKNKEGQTALMNAANAGDLESVKMLLEAGANVNARNKEGDSAWDLTGDEEIEALLESYGAETPKEEETIDVPDLPA